MAAKTFAEIDGKPVSQVEQDMRLWERLLAVSPARLLLELGTGTGTFSRWLLAACKRRDIIFRSFDRELPPYDGPWFEQADVFDPQSVKRIIGLFRSPMILFCDDGDKPREVDTYAPHLWPGDFLVVHDWGTEINWPDIPDGFTMVAEGDMTAWFLKHS